MFAIRSKPWHAYSVVQPMVQQDDAPTCNSPVLISACLRSCWFCTEAPPCHAALTRAKQLVVVVGTWDALRLAVESERSDQRMSTLQHRITNLAVAAGAVPDQRMHSFGALPSPVQQQSGGAQLNPPGPQASAGYQAPSSRQPVVPQRRAFNPPRPQTNAGSRAPMPRQPVVPQGRPEHVYAHANASGAPQMQQQHSAHYDVASPYPGDAT